MALVSVWAALAGVAAGAPAGPDVTLKDHTSAITALAFSPDARRLASIDSGGTLKLWTLGLDKPAWSVDTGGNGEVRQVRFSADGKRVVCLLGEPKLGTFDADTGKPGPAVAVPNLSGELAFDLSPDGRTAAVVGRGGLRVIDLASGDCRAAWDVHPNYGVTAVAFSPDGKRVATAGTDHTALVVDPATGKFDATLQLGLNGRLVAFTADGKQLLTWADDGNLRRFDATKDGTADDGKVVLDHGHVRTMALAPEGKSLVVGGPGKGPWVAGLSADGSTVVSDAYTSDNLVYAAAISPDGKTIAGGANEGTVYLWKAR